MIKKTQIIGFVILFLFVALSCSTKIISIKDVIGFIDDMDDATILYRDKQESVPNDRIPELVSLLDGIPLDQCTCIELDDTEKTPPGTDFFLVVNANQQSSEIEFVDKTCIRIHTKDKTLQFSGMIEDQYKKVQEFVYSIVEQMG